MSAGAGARRRRDTTFNYAALPADKAASARAAAERIRGRMQLAAESIIEVGRELIEQKKALGHGNFLPWIKAEFGMSRQTADNFVHVATRFGDKLPTISNLGATALYALAAQSTPNRCAPYHHFILFVSWMARLGGESGGR